MMTFSPKIFQIRMLIETNPFPCAVPFWMNQHFPQVKVSLNICQSDLTWNAMKTYHTARVDADASV